MDTAELVKLTKQSFEWFEEQFDYPYPFGKYDQLYVPEYNIGRDGERRLRDAARRVPPPQPPAALVLRVPRLGHHPRDGAHVVRRPRHHEVVGRPLAQRVVRRVGLLLVRGQRHRVRRRVDRLRQRPQADRLPRRPAALDAPDRGRQRRPARGRGQLRHDHLRQGRLGAQAARRVGRHRALPRGPAQLLQGVGVRQPGVQGPARHAGEVVGPRAAGLGPGVAADRGRQHARPVLRARRRRRLHVVRGQPDRPRGLADAAPAPPRHRPLRRGRRPPGASRLRRGRRRGRQHRGPRARRGRRSPRCCCSTTRTTPTPRSASTSGRWRPPSRRCPRFEDSLPARPRVGCRVGHDPRRRDAHPRLGPTWSWPTSAQETDAWARDPDPGVHRAGGQLLLRPRAPRRAQGRRGRRACASCCSPPSPAATTSSPSPAPTPAPPTATPRSTTSSACSTARSRSRAWPSTRTCAGR